MTHLPHFKQNKNILLKKCPHNFLVFNESLPLAKKKASRRKGGQTSIWTNGWTDRRTDRAEFTEPHPLDPNLLDHGSKK